MAFARAVVIFFRYFGLRARISSRLKSSGGCIIFEVIPDVGTVGGAAATVAGFCSSTDAVADEVALLVVGGALIVALLQDFKRISI